MAHIFKSLSSLLIVMAWCFLNGATAEEREGKQILLPAAPNYPFYYYASGRPVFVNAGETPTGTDARVSSKLLSSPDDYGTDAVGRTFFRIFGCPTCPTCPAPVVCPTCPTCAVCPPTPSIPAKAISLTPVAGECLTADTLNIAIAISGCSSVSSAPKGTIDVPFVDAQTVSVGIAAVTPSTQIKLTCTDIPDVAKTQNGGFLANTPVTTLGFMHIIGGSTAGGNRLKCSWESF